MAGKSIESFGIRFAPKSFKDALEGSIIFTKTIGIMLLLFALFLVIFKWGLSIDSIIQALAFVVIGTGLSFLALMVYSGFCAFLTQAGLTKTHRDALLTAVPFAIIVVLILLYHFLVEPLF